MCNPQVDHAYPMCKCLSLSLSLSPPFVRCLFSFGSLTSLWASLKLDVALFFPHSDLLLYLSCGLLAVRIASVQAMKLLVLYVIHSFHFATTSKLCALSLFFSVCFAVVVVVTATVAINVAAALTMVWLENTSQQIDTNMAWHLAQFCVIFP